MITKQIVDVTDLILRLRCKCGTSISVAPIEFTESALQCPACKTSWPAFRNGQHDPVQKLGAALRELQIIGKDKSGYRVQFEVEQPQCQENSVRFANAGARSLTATSGHRHQLIRRDESGDYYLDLLCPTCEAAGVTLSDEELRDALLQAEDLFQHLGCKLLDFVDEEALPEILRLLGRTTH